MKQAYAKFALPLLTALLVTSTSFAGTTDRQKLKDEIKAEVLKEIKKDNQDKSPSLLDGKLKISGQVRVRPEFRRNLTQAIPNVPGPLEENTSVLLRSRIGLEYSPVEHIGFFIQGQDSRDFGEEAAALPTPAGDDEGMDLHQGYIDITNIANKPYNIRVGRQEVKLGDERLLGAVNWSNVGRSLDGIVLSYEPERWGIKALAAITDRTGVSNVGDGQYLAGLYATWKKYPHGVLDGYYLVLQDNNGATGAAAGTGDTLSIHTVGTRIKAKYDSGFDYDIESAVQFGKFGSNSVMAFAEHGRTGYTFKTKINPRVGVEYNYATGDNVASAKYTKFNNLLPTNHAKYGLMDLATWSNMHDGAVSVSVAPGKWQVGLDYHMLMADKNTSASDTFLGYAGGAGLGKLAGHEVDLSAKWVMNKYFDVQSGFSHFIPGAFLKNQGMTTSSDLFFLQTQAQF